MRISHNTIAMKTSNILYDANTRQTKVLEKLGSGQEINRASDGSAELAISEKMRGELAALKQKRVNQQDLVAFANAQDGALNEISNILVHLQQLLVQGGDTWGNAGSVMMDDVATANIKDEITASAEAMNQFLQASINGISLLSDEGLTKTGATDAEKVINWQTKDGSTITTTKGVRDLIEKYNFLASGYTLHSLSATQIIVDGVNKLRSSIGAKANQAEAKVRNLSTQIENLQEAESRIRDTDMAEMTVEFQRNNIMNNAAVSMLAQANQQPQSVLSLLR